MLESRKQTLADRFLRGQLNPLEAEELTDVLEKDPELLEELKFDLKFRAAASQRDQQEKPTKLKKVNPLAAILLTALLVSVAVGYFWYFGK